MQMRYGAHWRHRRHRSMNCGINAENVISWQAIFPVNNNRPSAQHVKGCSRILALIGPNTRRRELRMKAVRGFDHAHAIDVLCLVALDRQEFLWNRQRVDIAINVERNARCRLGSANAETRGARNRPGTPFEKFTPGCGSHGSSEQLARVVHGNLRTTSQRAAQKAANQLVVREQRRAGTVVDRVRGSSAPTL